MSATMFVDLPNGARMPAIGLGTWQAEDEEIEKALDNALEMGYRHIDTAFHYANEESIGRVLAKWFSCGKLKREDLFITTKLPTFGTHPDRVEMFMKKSLQNLHLNYVDLYLIHFPICIVYNEGQIRFVDEKGEAVCEPTTDFEGVWKKMEEQVDAGRTKAIGISNFNIRQIERILKTARIKPANHQFECHMYMQQQELIEYCKSKGITIVAYSPLASPGYNKGMQILGKEPKKLPNLFENPVIKRVAQKHNKTPAQVCLRHLIQKGIAAIPKSVSPTRLKENISIFDFVLDADDVKSLDALNVGPQARVCDMLAFPGLKDHPEFPFK